MGVEKPLNFRVRTVMAIIRSIVVWVMYGSFARWWVTATIKIENGVELQRTGPVAVKAFEDRELAVPMNGSVPIGMQLGSPMDTIEALYSTAIELNAPPGIEEAIAEWARATAAAETIFKAVEARETAIGQVGNERAAEAARAPGARHSSTIWGNGWPHTAERRHLIERRGCMDELETPASPHCHLDEGTAAYNHEKRSVDARGDQKKLSNC